MMLKSDLNLKKIKKIYIACPANHKTGGTELLHQLANQLENNGKKVYIAYYLEGQCDKKNPTPDAFKQYIKTTCLFSDIEDLPDNLLILPEVCIGKHRKFKYIKKCVWWLSVDFYKNRPGYAERLKKYGFLSLCKHLILHDNSGEKDLKQIDIHLYQSYYAADFLKELGIPEKKLFYLSDYINDIYMEAFSKSNREDIVIYNPKKGLEFTKKLISAAPEIRWVPIINMSNEEVRELMKRAKVYTDFGNHPGKDRIPREAAMSGCCVITNRRGAANYYKDLPILNKYKYIDADNNIDKIILAIKDCINNYEQRIDDFSAYRKFISNEKTIFQNDVKKIFEDFADEKDDRM